MAEVNVILELNLGASSGSEMGLSFWNVSAVQMNFFVEKEWVKRIGKSKRKPNYCMLNMNAQLEEVVGNKLEWVGPMIDSIYKK